MWSMLFQDGTKISLFINTCNAIALYDHPFQTMFPVLIGGNLRVEIVFMQMMHTRSHCTIVCMIYTAYYNWSCLECQELASSIQKIWM